MPIHPSVWFWLGESITGKTSGPRYKKRHELEAKTLRTTPEDATKIISIFRKYLQRKSQFLSWLAIFSHATIKIIGLASMIRTVRKGKPLPPEDY
mmetsp:Transcript_14308/g.29597  ORF Transcript_14308/g.29597 Transcript_14308/m.29597 type:complete len:95 (-) Transcript_14308:74-358(-)